MNEISFGNTTAQTIYFGNSPVRAIWYGPSLVWQSGSTPPTPQESISISSGQVAVNSTASAFNITVTASSTAWTVDTDETWITAQKWSNTLARISYTAYNGDYREGAIRFKIDGVQYAYCVLTQFGNY